MKTAVQLFSLRELAEPLARTVERVAATGADDDSALDGVELAGLGDDPDAVVEALVDTGLDVAGAHVPFEAHQADPPGVADEYGALGCDHLVVPLLPPDRFAETDAIVEAAADLSTLARTLPDDVRLSYHNHEHEFAAVGDGDGGRDERVDGASDGDAGGEHGTESGLDVLASHLAADVGLELDVGWAVAAGADPVALLERHADRVELLHLKDVVGDPDAERGARPVALGEGEVDLPAVLAAARDADVEWVVVEHDDPDDPASWVSASATWLDGRV